MNPSGQPSPASPFPRRDPREELNIPSILLLVLAAVGVLWNLYSAVGPSPDLSSFDKMAMDPQAREVVQRLSGVAASAGRVLALVGLGLGVVMAYGAWQMRQLRQYPMAMASAIIGLLPFGGCCCCLSLPVGVWALVILSRQDVRQAFSDA